MSQHQMIQTGNPASTGGMGMGVVTSILLWMIFAVVRTYF